MHGFDEGFIGFLEAGDGCSTGLGAEGSIRGEGFWIGPDENRYILMKREDDCPAGGRLDRMKFLLRLLDLVIIVLLDSLLDRRVDQKVLGLDDLEN